MLLLIHSEQAVLGEPRIWLPSGEVKWGQTNKARQKHSFNEEKHEEKKDQRPHVLRVKTGAKSLKSAPNSRLGYEENRQVLRVFDSLTF